MSAADEALAEATRRYPPMTANWNTPAQDGEAAERRETFAAGAEWQASRNPDAAPSHTDLRERVLDVLYKHGVGERYIPEHQTDLVHEITAELMPLLSRTPRTSAEQKARAEYLAQFRGEWPTPQPSTITDAQVEAAKVAFWEHPALSVHESMRAALAAAGVTPAQPEQVTDEDIQRGVEIALNEGLAGRTWPEYVRAVYDAMTNRPAASPESGEKR